MAQASALQAKDMASVGVGVAAAWQRLWRRRESTGPAPGGDFWTSGVTYRGYLGADKAAPAQWVSQQQVKDMQALLAERFTRTLESLSDGFILLDHEWCFVYVNPEAERILRKNRDQLTGRCLLTEFPETAAGKFLELCQGAIKSGHSVEFEKFYQPLGIWVHMKFSPSELGPTFCIRDDTERITSRREILRLRMQLEARAV